MNKVYLSGIGGIGLSAIAYYFKNLGKEVVGSDLAESEVIKRLKEADIEINFKQVAKNISADIDLFIYSSALPLDHEELVRAKELKIPSLTYFQFLGLLSKKYKTIAVAGTNGKTTTTAMLGLMLEKAGLDPTVIVGSLVPQWGKNFRLGQSDILVVEACEWQAHMLEIKPQIIVLTNIAEDHLDFYKDLNDIKKHFQKFVNKLPADGLLIKNCDDQNSSQIKFRQIIGIGKEEGADCYFKNLTVVDNKQKFETNFGRDDKLSEIELPVPGLYNIYNALSAIAVANHLGVNRHQIWNALAEFKGTWRRFEIIGQMKSNIVISDYAHHPDSITMLLRATKDFYPDKKIIAVFQPHHHNRTKTLLDQFAKAFYLADQAIILEIYKVSGRESQAVDKVSSVDLLEKMNHKRKHYAADFKKAKEILKDISPVNAVILFIGAGDIDNLAREIID
ncbi:MAG: UDP-N-acetylmuramate--L-alanine ligase [Candidatus Komeilibacteria bacterium RIFOXYC1_FULL_37_11]|uniref:UDP-N-acetylmuramate--L-alanine ligase n=1 Tax=Candidatus Komeilibacteria bacterium RIFOXYC1_FULL_37_11 TaxID=1798555 RepID=A0A1G2BZW5_9BACT|nr:MAG: UDP-N-acetylmuramate--L-alanine ligase [Candidatus Komeilibacteria bacterium RIFOXYC1_FULL_37_11]OGY95592.1 MAG: UDP-N-acetylmuramate--L-alanine ligase [Candidatus Komeilibacteria bacterium RIFOXYD1_FULL_37_29]